MFLPCIDDVPLNEDGTDGEGYVLDNIMFKQYQQAKDRVLFEGFDFDPHLTCEMYFTIEDLINLNLTLTPNALKQFEL
jgi:hypothetical protein